MFLRKTRSRYLFSSRVSCPNNSSLNYPHPEDHSKRTALTFNDFLVLNTSKCRITLLLLFLIICSPFYIVVDKSLYCFLVSFVFIVIVVFSFKDIVTTSPPGTRFLFDWNPCTKFNEGDGCQGVLVSNLIMANLIFVFKVHLSGILLLIM